MYTISLHNLPLETLQPTLASRLIGLLLPIFTFYTALVKAVQCLCVSIQHQFLCYNLWLCSSTLRSDRSDRNTQQQPSIWWQLLLHALIPISFLMHKSDGVQHSRSLSSSAACIFAYFSLLSGLGPSRPSIIYKGFLSFFSRERERKKGGK